MSTTATITLPTVRPLEPPMGSEIDFGAQIDGVDLENLTGLWCFKIHANFTLLIRYRRAICLRPQGTV